jgi:predicted metallo-beta-lactamase superfamily hydrolase
MIYFNGVRMDQLENIKVLPVAFESLGVRSMCTYVETPDVKVLLDAGVSLAPNRYGLPPHPKEYAVLKERRELMLQLAEEADIVTISHYHFDHHTPSFTDWACNWSSREIARKIYSEKIVFAKNYKTNINPSQRRRGWMFHRTGGKKAARLEFADGRTFKFNATTIKFSSPVYHGDEKSELGWVLMTAIKHGEDVMFFAPDIQGSMYGKTVEFILAEKPKLVIIGGPPSYLAEYKISPNQIKLAMKNLDIIIKHLPITILDHHILRDLNWTEIAQQSFDKAKKHGHKIVTAAEYAGEQNRLLEAKRKILHEKEPPNEEFTEWTKIPLQQRKNIPPPI